jgi:hypothetical protein
MKKLISCFLLFSLLFLSNNLFSQSNELLASKIKNIKTWYAEMQTLNLNNCKTVTYIEYDGLSEYKMPFDQTISLCEPNDTYTLLKGDFLGYEWYEKILIYMKNKKIFFVYVEGSMESFSFQSRYYCDSDEKIIQQMDLDAEGGQALDGQSKKNESNLKKNIREIIKPEMFQKI